MDDQSLTKVLEKHLKQLDSDLVLNEPVKRINGSTGIVDLMLSRSIKSNKPDEIEHLVVELKAPKVKIKSKEISQIESYAFAVAADERFRGVKAKWSFWVVSNDLDDFAKRKAKQENLPRGVVYKSDSTEEIDVTVWVKSWAQIIQENKSRLNFIKEKLEYQANIQSSIEAIQNRYKHLLEGTKVDSVIDERISQDA